MFDPILNNDINPKSYSKGEILQRAGQDSSKIYFVKKGLLRSYTIDSKGKEHIFMFASEGWLVSDIESQSFKQKTVLFIDAIEETEAYTLHQQDFDLSQTNRENIDSMVSALMKRMGMMQRRILSLMSSSARERYESFLQIYPELPNRVPQRMIASYLGITPEALSVIRTKMTKG